MGGEGYGRGTEVPAVAGGTARAMAGGRTEVPEAAGRAPGSHRTEVLRAGRPAVVGRRFRWPQAGPRDGLW